jgi:imidazole glycerol-phosphate synthase subunit HisH
MTVVVVDYGVGNLGSILNMLKKLGAAAKASRVAADIETAERLILPGIGAFDSAMGKLKESGLIPVLEQRVLFQKTPLLGICLGMQLLANGSEEGALPGLGWIDADIKRFRPEQMADAQKIPHMGWNKAAPAASAPLFRGMESDARFYFAHSFHVSCAPTATLCETHYGYDFASGIVSGNVMGVQFHPEKSHRFGLKLLENYMSI